MSMMVLILSTMLLITIQVHQIIYVLLVSMNLILLLWGLSHPFLMVLTMFRVHPMLLLNGEGSAISSDDASSVASIFTFIDPSSIH